MISSHDTLWIVDEKNEDDTEKGCQKELSDVMAHNNEDEKKKEKLLH